MDGLLEFYAPFSVIRKGSVQWTLILVGKISASRGWGWGEGFKHGTRSRDSFERVNMSVNSKDSNRSMNLPSWSRYFVPVDSLEFIHKSVGIVTACRPKPKLFAYAIIALFEFCGLYKK